MKIKNDKLISLSKKDFFNESEINTKMYQNNITEIEGYLQHKIINNPNIKEYYLFLADYYIIQNRFDKAAEIALFLKEYNDAYGYYYLGCIHSYNQEFSKAIKFFEIANKLDTNSIIILREYGFALGIMGNIKGLYILKRAKIMNDRLKGMKVYMGEELDGDIATLENIYNNKSII